MVKPLCRGHFFRLHFVSWYSKVALYVLLIFGRVTFPSRWVLRSCSMFRNNTADIVESEPLDRNLVLYRLSLPKRVCLLVSSI